MTRFKHCHGLKAAVVASVIASITTGSIAPSLAEAHDASRNDATASPIKHVVVIIGENRGFDHIFATYKPKHGQKVANLLSRGIVKEDGTPGRNYADARQYLAAAQSKYYISTEDKTPNPLPFATEAAAVAAEPSLEPGDVHLLTTGGTGLPATTGVDTRVTDAFYLRNGPYQLSGPVLPYDALTGDMIHSFHQMWQQSDCSVSHATRNNPSGCLNDLYPFVAATSAATSQGGSNPMAFYNVSRGDAPYLKQLADEYTLSDNYHQAQMGGSTVEHLYLAMADTIYYSDGRGNPAQPPAARIANPDPLPGSLNQYTGGGAQYVACADVSQPGVAPIVNYLVAREEFGSD
jgi:phospholipase C